MCVTGSRVEPTPNTRDGVSASPSATRPRPPCYGRFTSSTGTARRGAFLLVAAVALALGASGCGGDEAPASAAADTPAVDVAPAPAAPVAVIPVALGGSVVAGPTTPPAVARALERNRTIVVGFVIPGVADDQRVAATLRNVEGRREFRDVRFFTYRVGRDRSFGALPDLLGVEGTPSVVVIAGDGSLANRFPGLVDAEILRQAIFDARDAAPGADGI